MGRKPRRHCRSGLWRSYWSRSVEVEMKSLEFQISKRDTNGSSQVCLKPLGKATAILRQTGRLATKSSCSASVVEREKTLLCFSHILMLTLSRFTARAIAGLIDNIGMLTKDGLPYLAEIFRDVQHRHDSDYKPKHPNKPFKNKPSVMDPRYSHELERRGMTRLRVPIKVIGVWDTVGKW